MTIPEGFSNSYIEQQEAMIADLRMMLNESTAVHADLKESMIKMVAEVATWRTRAERAEAALAAMIEQKEDFRICWEEAEAELANLKDELDRSAETLSPGPNLPGTN